MKAGTTWVHEYLLWRGDVCLPEEVKETHFFDCHFHRGLDWYSRHFSHFSHPEHRVTAEVAPSLFHSVEAPQRVVATIGPVTLIVVVRDPVERAWSHYLHLRRRGYTRASLGAAVREFPEIVAASCYQQQIARWRAAMPDALIHFLSLDDLKGDPVRYTAQLCAHLSLPMRAAPGELGRSNAAGRPKSYLLAKFGRKAAATLRSKGGYKLVNLAKSAGLKRPFFGRDGGVTAPLNAEDRQILISSLEACADSLGDAAHDVR